MTVTTTCGVFPGTMGIEVRPAEVERHQGSLYSMTSDLTVTKHLDKVTVELVCSLPLLICDFSSSHVPRYRGVLQGSILGPVLFSLYVLSHRAVISSYHHRLNSCRDDLHLISSGHKTEIKLLPTWRICRRWFTPS